MERIRDAFAALGSNKALIPFIVAGDPDYDQSFAIARAILASGADMLEIGFPYSDPLADGPVIQAAALRSLNRGCQLPDCFRLVRDLRSETNKPLIAFTYVNPLMQYGATRFFAELAQAGGDGVIVPDVPLEEAPELARVAADQGIAWIPLVAPTSGEERIQAIAQQARGFVYCVSSLGVTANAAPFPPKWSRWCRPSSAIRAYLPVSALASVRQTTCVKSRLCGRRDRRERVRSSDRRRRKRRRGCRRDGDSLHGELEGCVPCLIRAVNHCPSRETYDRLFKQLCMQLC
ncbi:hypothetical protein GCM10025858_02060 [Alicyclobacillus sacchari]|uniref:tryptophan synthase subunit alpha n=1 Tax=Alicyclobacillus sacchari TaxID=392010 RepID=UPI0023E99E86|nr:tryptophan synthase subunit alpha [Alicyclobacillus sacchari]GMA55703.1 hypothetical protein GCM10025858_02060 [Alicyclobacillus sacchari]